jgi:ATP-dependent RNA/DNA helicase IGHMBP2
VSQIPEIDAFVAKHRELLELERQEEVEESRRLHAELSDSELERRGVALLRLKVAEEGIGLGGRTLLVLAPSRGGELPAHRIATGDIVTVRSAASGGRDAAEAPTAIVYRVRDGEVTVALDDADAELEEPLRLDRVANDVTYRRLREALEKLEVYERGPARRLREVLFGRREPSFEAPSGESDNLELFDRQLDASQRQAVAFALSARDVALVHGPPGTGKTTAVAELIRQAVRRGERVLATAPSNVAVDNLVERLAGTEVRLVRLGHPARLLPTVVEHSLDYLLEASEGTRIALDLRREIADTQRQVRKSHDWAQRRARRDELRRLRGELRKLEERTVQEIVRGADVVFATLTGAADSLLAGAEFDLAVIDEAAQAVEAGCWIPLLAARRAVLAGDHLQLPPTILSRRAQKEGLGRTLFERLAEAHGERITRRLSVQYRMHERIMTWSSEALYGGGIEAHASVRAHLLQELPQVAPAADTAAPLVFIDTAGCDFEEEREAQGDSRSNPGEARLLEAHVGRLLAAGVRPQEIAVITPYNAQVGLLRASLHPRHPELEIASVDGFQGREKEAVVISLVRSNPRGEVGFLADERRLNVAVTRARRHVAIIGDSATVAAHPFLAQLVAYFQEHGDYRSAWEYA